MMELIHNFWDVITNLRDNLEIWTTQYGTWIYAILFLIIFCETGLVVMPFLPGDSLLFTAGALCAPAVGEKMSIGLLMVLLPAAAIIGDNLNYWIGRKIGPKVFSRPKSVFFNTEILHKTQSFYDKHGKKMVILARFVPLVRTFAPFVAGVGKMDYRTFLIYGIFGAVFWVGICAGAGYAFGNTAWVKKNFEVMILAVIGVSLLPAVFAWWGTRREAKQTLPAKGSNPQS